MESMKKQISKEQIQTLQHDEDIHYKLLLLAELQGFYEKLLKVLVISQEFNGKMIIDSANIMKKIASLLMYNAKFWNPINIAEFNTYKKRIKMIKMDELKICIKQINRFIKKYSEN